MGTQAVATRDNNAAALTIEQVLMTGDLSKLSAEQRVIYHNRVCESLGLNPLTRPFDYLSLNNKLILYARKDATDQLRRSNGISITAIEREQVGDLYVVTARATMPDGRTDESLGAVNVKGLAGEALANALMKAETKAKRRVTLSLSGLGILDEMETDSLDPESGELSARPTPRAIEQPQPRNRPMEEPLPTADFDAFWAATGQMGYSEKQVLEFVGLDTIEMFTQDELNRCQADLRTAKGEPTPQMALGT